MKLIDACKDILGQLSSVIKSIEPEDFRKEVPNLNNSTVGQHIRHTLEFFTCLMNNHKTGFINYDERDHDKVIETDTLIAQAVIEDIIDFLNTSIEDKPLVLEANYSFGDETGTKINTNLHRELAYNIEHAIHHMAIIKIGLKEVASYIDIPGHFGVAVSTIKYQKQTSS
ncbi:MAG: DinB family protein [Bacteroidota bacterium]